MGPKELKVPLYSYAMGSEGLRPGAVRDEELVSQEEILPWPSCGTAWDTMMGHWQAEPHLDQDYLVMHGPHPPLKPKHLPSEPPQIDLGGIGPLFALLSNVATLNKSPFSAFHLSPQLAP